jgi:ferredoxin/flavodoxin
MKTCIYVLSGTGTSLAVANGIGDSLENTEIKLIPEELRSAAGKPIKPEAATVGFVFPNYFGGVPQMVSDLIQIFDFSETTYIFAIVTAGGGQGYSLKFFEENLAARGKRLDYGKYATGVSNYIVAWYYTLVCNVGERRINDLSKLKQKSKQFASDIMSRKREIQKSKFLVYMVNRLLSPNRIIRDTRPWDRDFSVDARCIGCKTCEKVCQSNNIIMEDHRPEFQHNCQRCMACIQYCPQNAIGFKGKPLAKPRYFHPDYPAKEMITVIHGSESC